MPRCQAYKKVDGERCSQTAKIRYCHRHREVKNRGLPRRERERIAANPPSRKMSRLEKIKRWGKVVARYRSRSSNITYNVRKKNQKFSCNCPGWINKREGQPRSCAHITKAKLKLRRATVTV